MADRPRDLDHLRRISEALDDEAEMPEDLDADGAAFLAGAERLRARLRVAEAEVPPDVTDAVLARLRPAHESGPPEHTRRRSARPAALVAAAVFVVAALAAGAATRPGGPLAPEPAVAGVGDDVLRSQHDVAALDAAVGLVERGAHPDVPVRRYTGTLRYQAPERLWLRLAEVGRRPAGFPANDLELVVDEGRAWSTGLRDCPVGEQPACLEAPRTRSVEGLAPFAADWVAPLDLVVPADAFLPAAATDAPAGLGADRRGDAVVIESTVARFQRTIDGLRAAGALRAVHPTDRVHLELDAVTSTIRRLVVRADDSGARSAWAASNGYTEPAGTEVLDLTVDHRPLPDTPFPLAPDPPPEESARTDAGFVDTAASDEPAAGGEVPEPAWLPEGFSAHRRVVRSGSGSTASVRSWTDGRAWIRLDVTRERVGDRLVGDLGPLVRRLRVGDGFGYTDPGGSTVALHTEELDLVVTGSVPLDVLVRTAASLPVTGRELPSDWPQSDLLADLPAGALAPEGPLLARYEGRTLLVAVPGPGGTSAVLRQRPGAALGTPRSADVVEVAVRGVRGRYEPGSQTVRWIEDGWVRELRSAGLGLDDLLAVAEGLS